MDSQYGVCFMTGIPQGNYQLISVYFQLEGREIVFYRAAQTEFAINGGGVYLFTSLQFTIEHKIADKNFKAKGVPIIISEIQPMEFQTDQLSEILSSDDYVGLKWNEVEIKEISLSNL